MKIIRPLKAIRAKCVDCCGGSGVEVKFCEIEDCPLFIYRFGKNPNRARRVVATRSSFSKKPQISNYSNRKNGHSTADQ